MSERSLTCRTCGHFIGPDAYEHQEGEPAVWVVLSQSNAEKIVAAVEGGRAHEVIQILKGQAWWLEICAGVRRLARLKPIGSIEPNQIL